MFYTFFRVDFMDNAELNTMPPLNSQNHTDEALSFFVSSTNHVVIPRVTELEA